MIKGTSDKLTFELSSEFPKKTNPAKAWGRKEGLGPQEAALKAQERSGWTARVVRVEVRQGQDKTFASYSKGKWRVTGVFQEGGRVTWCMLLKAHRASAWRAHNRVWKKLGTGWQRGSQLAGGQETFDATLSSENIVLDKQLNFHFHEMIFSQTKGEY